MERERRYWFKAKKSGLGWSTPLTWQGWVVYISMFGAVAYFAITGADVGRKMLGVWIPIVICIPVFWVFGEPLSRGRNRNKENP
jgi:hypothetical protein